jgi:hypothetical protein
MIQTLISRWWTWAIVLVGATCAVYAISLNAPFIWDDEVMVVGNTLIRDFAHIGRIFTTAAFGEPFHPSLFYRPIQILSFSVDYHFWGLNPLGYRLTNLLLHSINSILVLVIFRRFFSPVLAGLLAVIFAVHPIGIECVTYVSGRGDVLSTCLALVSVACVIQYAKAYQHRWLFFALIAYCVALITKENIVFIPFVWLIYDRFFLTQKSRLSRLILWSGVMISIGFSVFRFWGGLDRKIKTLSFIADSSLLVRLMTIPKSMMMYLKLVIWPYPLHMEYHFVSTSLFTWWSLGFILVCVAIGLWLKKSYLKPILAWFLLIMVMGVLPVNNVVPALASTIREHWFYLSLVGALGCVGVGLTELKERAKTPYFKDRIVIAVLCIFCALFSVVTIYRNLDWTNPVKFYTHDIQHEPYGFVLYNNLGVELFRAGDIVSAAHLFQKSIDTSPRSRYGIAYNNLGAVYMRGADFHSAEALFKASIAFSDYPLAYRNLIAILYQQGRYMELINWLDMAVAKFPQDPDFRQMRLALQK